MNRIWTIRVWEEHRLYICNNKKRQLNQRKGGYGGQRCHKQQDGRVTINCVRQRQSEVSVYFFGPFSLSIHNELIIKKNILKKL